MAVVKVREADLVSSSNLTAPPTAAQQQQQQSNLSSQSPAAAAASHSSSSVAMVLHQMQATVVAVRSGQTSRQTNGQAAVDSSSSSSPRWLQMPANGAAAAGVALVIDGAALAVALQPQHEDALLQLCKECSAVICCRVSPMQKAQVGCICCRRVWQRPVITATLMHCDCVDNAASVHNSTSSLQFTTYTSCMMV